MAAPIEPNDVLQSFQILMSPKSGSDQGQTSPADDRQRFDLSLHATISAFREELLKLPPKSSIVEEITAEFPKEPGDGKDIRWQFVLYCLKLMSLLKISITTAMEEFERHQAQQKAVKKIGPNDAPPLSPDTLSFGQQKMVLTALQFITCIGIVPCLEPGVGVPLDKRSGFGKILSGSQKIPEVERCWRLLHVIRMLLECAQQPTLGGLILSRHLGDLLAGLLQMCHSPLLRIKESSRSDLKKSPESLDTHLSCNAPHVDDTDKECREGSYDDQPLFSSPADIGFHPVTSESSKRKSEQSK